MTAGTAASFSAAARSQLTSDAFVSLSELEFRLGDWRGAHASAVEALRLAHAAGARRAVARSLGGLAIVEAGVGSADACRRHARQALELADGLDPAAIRSREALGLLELGLGDLDAAITWLEPVTRSPYLASGGHDLVEALVRRGDRECAAHILSLLPVGDVASPHLGRSRPLARCQGLLAADDQFELHFSRALECRFRLDEPFERARTELCFGQRLRRVRRRQDARTHISAALATFERLVAVAWADTARRELDASSQRARRRVDSTRDELTAQERQVAQIVARGATNRETAGRLFVTEKTIETHLSRIYRKLGLRSRTELARLLAIDRGPLDAHQPDDGRPSGAPESSSPSQQSRTASTQWLYLRTTTPSCRP